MIKSFSGKKGFVVFIVLLLSVSLIGLTACSSDSSEGGKEKLVFADAQWESIQVHNSIAQTIIEEGLGYPTDVISGSTPATFTGFVDGEIDIYMELWQDNIQEQYDKAVENGDIIILSSNFDDNAQGLYVPSYVIEGEPDRGIEPMAPDLKTVEDLKKYPEVFKDEEDPSKGRVYGAPPGWAVDEIMQEKFKTKGLDEKFNYFSPGSDSALAASLSSAYEKGEPWVGYYWEPTWVSGKYDITLLEDDPFNEEDWENGYQTEFKPVDVTIGVHNSVEEKAPEVVEFLKKYKTSSALTAETLAYMQDNDASIDEAAEWFLKEKEDIWTKWVSEDVAKKVKDSLN
jgi:glycine betaine/proline transport system substrate-binding protein